MEANLTYDAISLDRMEILQAQVKKRRSKYVDPDLKRFIHP